MNIAKRALTIALRHPIYLVIYIGFLSVMGVVLMGEVDGGAQASETAGTEGFEPGSRGSTATTRPFRAGLKKPLPRPMSSYSARTRRQRSKTPSPATASMRCLSPLLGLATI